MKMDRLRDECSIKGKNGIAFLLAATILWLCFVIVYLQPFDLRFKNVIVLMMTALLFPLSWGISMMIKAEWLQKKHPFSELGLILNYAQLAYLPLVICFFADAGKNDCDVCGDYWSTSLPIWLVLSGTRLLCDGLCNRNFNDDDGLGCFAGTAMDYSHRDGLFSYHPYSLVMG